MSKQFPSILLSLVTLKNTMYVFLLLQGHHFKVETLPEAPYTTKMELNPNTGKYEVEGSFPDLLKGLSVLMNFTYTVTPPPDGAWGGYNGDFPDGTWNGMMNQVVNERIDFGKDNNLKVHS